MTIKTYQRGTSIGERLDDVKRIKLEIDRLGALLDEHKAYLLGHAIRNDYEGLQLGEMTLRRRERASWVYSARVKAAEDQLKLLKNKEQNAGTAKCSLSEHLVINFDTKAILLAQQVEVAQ